MKRKILIHSNSHLAFTGFGKNCKNILKYLYQTGKYELYELANGVIWSDNEESFPWKFYGSLPNDQRTLSSLNSNPALARSASYGLLTIDKAIEKIEPDVYIGIEDIWAFTDTVNKPWWNKPNCMIWTTLDSIPILPDAIAMAPKIKNYYVWASFAEKAMKNLGISHVKTLHGSIDERNFHRLPDPERLSLRSKHGIDRDSFIIGYVFRNQLRKTVGDLIIGFKFFKDKFPESNPKLLLHTNFAEGWDIPRFMAESGISQSDILTTYFCPACKNYKVASFCGNGVQCPFCGKKDSFSTSTIQNGVSEPQLNEVYNLMDLYVHPFTSGGQEIPIQEAKLTELITLVTNYTCGEEMCTEESGGIPLSWSPYREIGTQFIKASTYPIDIAQKIALVYQMSPQKRLELGKIARKYVLDNYSFNVIGKRLEDIIDAMPKTNFKYKDCIKVINPDFTPKPQYSSDIDFVKDLFKGFFSINASDRDPQLIEAINKIRSGYPAKSIVASFRDAAHRELAKKSTPKIDDYVDINDKTPRIAVYVPNDTYISFIYGYFLESLKKKYPNHKIYIFADKGLHYSFFPYLDLIEKLCPHVPNCDNKLFMEGSGDNNGYFDICFVLNKDSMNLVSYSHNGMEN